jgi:hypothetical protein
MAEAKPGPSRTASLAKTTAKFAAAWLFVFSQADCRGGLFRFDAFARDAIYRVFAGFPSAARQAEIFYTQFSDTLGAALVVTLFFATGLAALGAVVRMLARAGARAGRKDFLDPARAWTSAHTRATRALLLAPLLLPAFLIALPRGLDQASLAEWFDGLVHGLPPLVVAIWAMYRMERKGLRELLAPTLDAEGLGTRFQIAPDEISFDAVAVTRRTVALVGAFSALMVLLPLIVAKLPILELFRHGALDLYLFGGYAAFAAVGAYAFRKASRVAVGVDGIHVHGTARAQFFAYRDLEAVRVNGTDIELVRRGSVVLRLQLHGEDAARRDAILARVTENIVRASEKRGGTAAQIVATASPDALARIAQGAGDYRMATLSREQLWGLVEGPEIDSNARRAAAEALARASGLEDRARLRVAAERCAEPNARVALEEIAGDVEEVALQRERAAHARG